MMATFAEKPLLLTKRFAAEMERAALTDYVAATSLLFVLFFGFPEFLTKFAVQISLFLVVLKFTNIKNVWLWVLLSVAHSIVLLDNWMFADNHKYLMVYWLYVVTIALVISGRFDADKYLMAVARFFIVFIFCVAALQKSLSPTFTSGEMFELNLLLDSRFTAFGHLFGVDQNSAEASRRIVASLKSPFVEIEGNAVVLPSTDWTRTLAQLITWYDVIIQFMIGLLFVPSRRITDFMGHCVFLFFILTTYLPAPVFGFGWLLCILGLCVAWDGFKQLRTVYLFSFIAILIYQSPWRAWVLNW